MKRVLSSAGWIALVVALCAATLSQPHVVRHWALYLGSPEARQDAELYLDPFPSELSCVRQARVFERNAERAFCADRFQLEFGNAADAVLAADFQRLLPIGWYCTPRKPQRRGIEHA
jgi:hypothetical protein